MPDSVREGALTTNVDVSQMRGLGQKTYKGIKFGGFVERFYFFLSFFYTLPSPPACLYFKENVFEPKTNLFENEPTVT